MVALPTPAEAAGEALARKYPRGEAAVDTLVVDVGHSCAFVAAVQQGLKGAEEGHLVTFGVVPSAPETGYGYIRGGAKLPSGILELAEFVEKPDANTASRYLEDGNFYWNSGMFLLGAQSYLDALLQHQPEMHRLCCTAMAGAARRAARVRRRRECDAARRAQPRPRAQLHPDHGNRPAARALRRAGKSCTCFCISCTCSSVTWRPCGVGRPRPGTPTATRTCWTPDYPRRREPR